MILLKKTSGASNTWPPLSKRPIKSEKQIEEALENTFPAND